MDQIAGLQEMRFLAQTGSDAARLAALARSLDLLEEDADPDVASWETCLLELRRCLSGPRIHAELTCPDCGEGVALIFGLDDLPRVPAPLPDTVAGVPLGPLHLRDLVAIELAAGNRLECVLMRATGQPANWARGILEGPDAAEVAATLERALSGLDLQIGTACTGCEARIVIPFDVQAFVTDEMRGSAQRLLDEVHVIAGAYHWSETEILSLPRDRRRAYLGRIERDALQVDIRDVGR